MSQSQEKIRSLWPLPGGNDQYLFTLVQALQWLAQKDDETRDEELNAWFQKEYHVGEKTAPGYIDVIKRLEAIQIDDKGRVTLTPFGEKIVSAETSRDQADLVVHRFMQDYLAFPEVLHIYDDQEDSIHLDDMVGKLMPAFPRWTSVAQYEYRALWLLSLGCLEQDRGRHYQITTYGRQIAEQYPVSLPVVLDPELPEEKPVEAQVNEVNKLEQLVIELSESARDSKNSDRFEAAIAEAFQFLGFKVDQLGEPGNTDVLLTADIGVDSYRVVVDGKSRSGGKLMTMDTFNISEHRDKNKADYIIVVAEDFAGGNLITKAQTAGIVLLPVEVFVRWMRLHAETPFNLRHQRSMFEESGRLQNLSPTLKAENMQRKRWAALIFDLIKLVEETYSANLRDPLSNDNLFKMLVTRLGGVQYPEEMIASVVSLLSQPALGGVLSLSDDGVSLQMNLENTICALRASAWLLESMANVEE